MPKISIYYDSGPVRLDTILSAKVAGFIKVRSEVSGGDAFVVRTAGRVVDRGDLVSAQANAINDFGLFFVPDSVSSGALGTVKFEAVFQGRTTLYEYTITVVPRPGTLGDDNIYGGNGNDSLVGLTGRDGLWGRDGKDSLYGGIGDDYLVGGAGADLLDGGANFDIAAYDDATSGVLIDLAKLSLNTGDAKGDTYTSIERFIGSAYADIIRGDKAANDFQGGTGNDQLAGREGNDTLSGGVGNDTLSGDAGNDSLAGGVGNDWLIGGAGADTFDGGTGVDTASYEDATARVVVNLTSGLREGDAKGDSFIAIEMISGSTFGDILTGNGSANGFDGSRGNDTLIGNGGNDTLLGGDGHDQLSGGDGADSIDGGAGNDLLTGGLGADSINGGAGSDTLTYEDAKGIVMLNLQGAGTKGDAAGDVVTGVEVIFASSYADTFIGDDLGNLFYGRGGGDTFYGRGGADTLYGEDGNDRLAGEAGNDLLYGGAGKDEFYFHAKSWGKDTIADFEARDTIILDGVNRKTVSVLQMDVDGDGRRDDVRIVSGDNSIDVLHSTVSVIDAALVYT